MKHTHTHTNLFQWRIRSRKLLKVLGPCILRHSQNNNIKAALFIA